MGRFRLGVVGTRGIPDVPGGVENHCAELYPRIAAKGVDVTVYGREGYVAGEREWRGVRVVALPAPSGKGVEAAVHTWRAIRAASRERCDLIHVHSVGPAMMLPLARVLGMRTVLTVHAPDYLQKKWGPLARAYLRAGERTGVKWADEVACVSAHQAHWLESRYGRTIAYVPSGAPSVRRVPPSAFLRSLGFSGDDYVLFVGRLIRDKRVEDLLAAVSAIPEGIRVLIVGDSADSGTYSAGLRDLAGSQAVFAGSRTGAELAELFSNARLFVLPSSVEGLPLSLIEAAAYGLPCIASDIPGNREILAEAGSGTLVPLRDVDALRDAIWELWADAARRKELGETAERSVHERYDWDLIADATMEMYARARGRHA